MIQQLYFFDNFGLIFQPPICFTWVAVHHKSKIYEVSNRLYVCEWQGMQFVEFFIEKSCQLTLKLVNLLFALHTP